MRSSQLTRGRLPGHITGHERVLEEVFVPAPKPLRHRLRGDVKFVGYFFDPCLFRYLEVACFECDHERITLLFSDAERAVGRGIPTLKNAKKLYVQALGTGFVERFELLVIATEEAQFPAVVLIGC